MHLLLQKVRMKERNKERACSYTEVKHDRKPLPDLNDPPPADYDEESSWSSFSPPRNHHKVLHFSLTDSLICLYL